MPTTAEMRSPRPIRPRNMPSSLLDALALLRHVVDEQGLAEPAEAYSPPIAPLRNDGAGGPAVGLYSRRRLPRKGSAAVAARALAHSVSHVLPQPGAAGAI